ncbi:integral membrane component of membrane efflux system [Salmonella bongori]|nr:integral membrane component of membrane efflux system [Salmonella bongori]
MDDAIVVVENVHRHIESGKSPLAAAMIGAREVAGPVIAMTLTLAAVLCPHRSDGRVDWRHYFANLH